MKLSGILFFSVFLSFSAQASGRFHINPFSGTVDVISHINFYGSEATPQNVNAVVASLNTVWNETPRSVTYFENGITKKLTIRFIIDGTTIGEKTADPEFEKNRDCANNFVRLGHTDKIVNLVDRSIFILGGNTGWLNTLDGLVVNKTAAHEFGHSLGLEHDPIDGQFEGKGRPGIMTARGSVVDAEFQENPSAHGNSPGSRVDPGLRKVRQAEIDALNLSTRIQNGEKEGCLGTLTSLTGFRDLDREHSSAILRTSASQSAATAPCRYGQATPLPVTTSRFIEQSLRFAHQYSEGD